MPVPSLTAAQLRRELNLRAEAWAREHHLLYDLSPGPSPSVVFGRDPAGRHGNFHPASDHAIRANPALARRLEKPHTASRRSAARKDWRWRELDAAISSDTLLMNVFCHPGVCDSTGLVPQVATLLGVDPHSTLTFGACPGIPLHPSRTVAEPVDRTEIDLAFSPHAATTPELLLEAKLTESDFQTAAPALAARYRDLAAVFDLAALPRRLVGRAPILPPNLDPDDPTVNLPRPVLRDRILGYQLVRNVLAAHATQASFCVLVDARRRDLIEHWFAVLSAVHAPGLRWRLKLLTWQELAHALPLDLRTFLAQKYGILPPDRRPGNMPVPYGCLWV